MNFKKTTSKNMVSKIKITNQLSIPLSELKFTAIRSSGPGGLNVNKVNTRVTLWFDVANSPSLSDWHKYLTLNHLPTRIKKEGVLRVVSQKHRSQASNRDVAIERFTSLLRGSLKEALPRKKTTIPRAVKKRRLDNKKHRSRMKENRFKINSLVD